MHSRHFYITQTVPASGVAGDTFVLTGWGWGNSAPLPEAEEGEHQREFSIIGTFNYSDNTTKSFTAQFNPDTDSSVNWQYAAEVMVAEKAYSHITVELAYDYNVNSVRFDGIQLYKEQFGSSYTYDEDGNVKSVIDLQKKNTTYEYDNNNLTQIIENGKAKMTYTYDDWHNVKTATTEKGITYTFEYDKWGNNTSVSIEHDGAKITSSAVYSADGNRLVSTKDALGYITTYDYDANTNVLKSVKYPKDIESTKTTYTYDEMYRMATAAATTSMGSALSATYAYTNDLLTGIQTKSTAYTFTYGSFGLRTSVKAGDRTLATYTYTDNKNKDLQTLAYNNGDSVQYTYDSKGRVLSQTYEDGVSLTYRYDNDGNLGSAIDSATEIKTLYLYDTVGRLRRTEETGEGLDRRTNYIYDTNNNLTTIQEKYNGVWSEFNYAYDADNRISKVTYFNANTSYNYDNFGRLLSYVTNHTTHGDIVTESFTYNGNSTQVKSMTSAAKGNRNVTYNYTYDSNGNIISIISGGKKLTYVYDTANQLIRENNEAAGYTRTWIYDDAGNIKTRKMYDYTETNSGTVREWVDYTYADTQGWGDLLTSVSGYTTVDDKKVDIQQTFTYDEIGNPTSDGIWDYTWEHGRQLKSMSKGSEIWNYTYNAEGLRTGRSSGTATYTYRYSGDQLRQMNIVKSGQTVAMSFIHNADGPMLVGYNGTLYYYTKNLQGDITGLVDSNGNSVVEYTYDAWGNVLSITGSLKDTLGVHNPLRYRGYVYDEETELYYLQSRYYNPELRRFLNADGLVSTGQGLLSNNMFAYCLNNPVMYVDPTGLSSHNAAQPWLCQCSLCNTSKNYVNKEPSFFETLLLHMARPRKKGNTFSVGVSGGANSGGITGGKSGVLSVDTSHNYAFQGTTTMGVAPGVGGSGGLIMTYTNATNVQDLAGASNSYGGTVVAVAGVSIDYITFTPSSNPNTTCWGISVVISLGGELEVHAAENYTTSTKSWNPFLSLHNFLYGG